MSKPRICFVVATPLTAKAFLIAHMLALSHRFSVDLICNTDGSPMLDGLIGKVRIIPVKIHRDIKPTADLQALLKLCFLFRANRYDAILSVTPKAGLLAMLAAFIDRIPIRIHIFTGQVWVTKKGLNRQLLKMVDKFVAALTTESLTDSPSQRDFLIYQGVVRATKIHVLADGSISGVDADRFKPSVVIRNTVRHELEIPQNAKVLLFLGRLNIDKGILDLAHAYASLATKYDDLWLLVVGPDEGSIGAEVARICAGQCDRIRRIGFTSEPERFMIAADIFVLPSYREGFGSSVIEAAACGLPSVCSKIYGLTDAVVDGVTGVLHAPANVLDLQAKIEQLIDPGIRDQLAKAARERVLQKFGQPRLTDALGSFMISRVDDYNNRR